MNARDLAAGAALTIGIVGAVWAWVDRPGSVDVPAGRSDIGAYIVKPLSDSAPIGTADGGTLLPVAEFETRGRVLHIERFKRYQSLANWVPGLRRSVAPSTAWRARHPARQARQCARRQRTHGDDVADRGRSGLRNHVARRTARGAPLELSR